MSELPHSEFDPARRPGLIWLFIGILPLTALFVASAFFGSLEVHSSNDTYIGLAGGRLVTESGGWPSAETFHDPHSYTREGERWFDQNWMTHVVQWWLYSGISPNSVIYGHIALCFATYALVAAACWYRTRDWILSLIIASVVAYACRDWMSARPATTGFFLMAGLGFLLAALESQFDKRRWWPIWALLPLLFVWGHAHGSFVFAYGLLGAYIGIWAGMRLLLLLYETTGGCANLRHWLGSTPAQIAAIAGVLLLAFLLTWWTSPFGLDNFFHFTKMDETAAKRSNEIWRQVSEWKHPFAMGDRFPPVFRFWTILIGGCCVLLFAWLVMDVDHEWVRRRRDPHYTGPPALPGWSRITPFDWFAAFTGYWLTLAPAKEFLGIPAETWPGPDGARRFAPILWIYGAPLLCLILSRIGRRLSPCTRNIAKGVTLALATLAAIGVAQQTLARAKVEIWNRMDKMEKTDDWLKEASLLYAVTRLDATPWPGFRFIHNNQLEMNLATDWTWGGLVAFFSPSAKVMIDGRAQQVYEVEDFQRYGRFYSAPQPVRDFMDLARQTNTNAILVMPSATRGKAAFKYAASHPNEWRVVGADAGVLLFATPDSPVWRQMRERIEAGTMWWPATDADPVVGANEFARGNAFYLSDPPDIDRAIDHWRRAVDTECTQAAQAIPMIAYAMLQKGDAPQAEQFVKQQDMVLQRGRVPRDCRNAFEGGVNQAKRILQEYKIRLQRQQGADQTP